jgi:hypothetical protein
LARWPRQSKSVLTDISAREDGQVTDGALSIHLAPNARKPTRLEQLGQTAQGQRIDTYALCNG